VVAVDHLCDVGASLFSEQELSQFTHTWQVEEGLAKDGDGRDIQLHIDYRMMGVGGDDSWSGLTVLPAYWVPPKRVKYSLLLFPLATVAGGSLVEMCRQAIPPERQPLFYA